MLRAVASANSQVRVSWSTASLATCFIVSSSIREALLLQVLHGFVALKENRQARKLWEVEMFVATTFIIIFVPRGHQLTTVVHGAASPIL